MKSLFETKNLIGIFIFIFGTIYSFLSDLTDIIYPHKFSKIVFIFIFFLLAIGYIHLQPLIVNLFAKYFGFSKINRVWIPSDNQKREGYTRKIMSKLFKNGQEIRIITVTGEWDIIKLYSDTELFELLNKNKIKYKILLCHPLSEGLKIHCENEASQDLERLQKKIIDNTKKLIKFGNDSCNIRWYLNQPIFHIVGNQSELHFGYYPQGKRGHYSHRYIVNNNDPLYRSINIWFENLWESSLDAKKEIDWVDLSVSIDKAIFLDRDDTLIKDIGYSIINNEEEIEILDGVIEGLKLLYERKYRLIVISNQQAVGLGIKTYADLATETKLIKDYFQKYNIYFDKFYYCTHSATMGCNCRKPKPNLFYLAKNDFHLDFKKCHFIGDSPSDKEVNSYINNLKVHIINKNNSFLDIVKNEIL